MLYLIPAKFFDENNFFQNALITFIHQKLRQDHRKIKATVTVAPTKLYSKVLKRSLRNKITRLDVTFSKEIQLHFPIDYQKKSNSNLIQNINNNDTTPPLTINVSGDANLSFDKVQSDYDEILKLLRFLIHSQKAVDNPTNHDTNTAIEIEDALNENESDDKDIKNTLKKYSKWISEKSMEYGLPLLAEYVKKSL